ncbi:MAG: ABC transporter permease [Candidatus Ancillula sp.]|jgi:hypothetical protein|nr:ABC transporter permease [Candidatus Ancillula sp.]
MYSRLLLKFIKSNKARFSLITLAVSVAIVCVLLILSGINAVLLKQERDNWAIFQASTLDEANYTRLAEVWENYDVNVAKGTRPGDCSVTPKGIQVFLIRGQGDSTGFPWVKTPEKGEFYLSERLSEIWESYKRGEELGPRFDDIFSRLGERYLGVLPKEMTPSPDTLMVVRYYSDEDEVRLIKAKKDMDAWNTGEVDFCSKEAHLLTLESDPGNDKYTNPQFDTNLAQELHPRMNIFMTLFELIAIIGLLFPICLLISISTGLGAKQKEQRFAAMRLIGATKGQISRLMGIETAVSTVIGIILGYLAFNILRTPVAQNFTLNGTHFYQDDLNYSPWQLALSIVTTVALAIIVNARSFSKVNISPLGVVSGAKVNTNPRFLGLFVLLAGVGITAYLLASTQYNTERSVEESSATLNIFFVGFILTLLGLLLCGSWVIYAVSRRLSSRANSALGMLSFKRWEFMPRVVFRSCAGVIVCMYIGSFVYTLAGVYNAFAEQQGNLLDINNPFKEIVSIGTVFLVITVIIATIGLSVSTANGLLERKESFATLHLSGVSLRQLRALVLIESVVPMVFSVLISAALGYFMANTMLIASANSDDAMGGIIWRLDTNLIIATLGCALLSALAVLLVSVSLRKIVDPLSSRKE